MAKQVRVRFLKATVAAKRVVKMNEVKTLDAKEAQLLIGAGKAVKFDGAEGVDQAGTDGGEGVFLPDGVDYESLTDEQKAAVDAQVEEHLGSEEKREIPPAEPASEPVKAKKKPGPKAKAKKAAEAAAPAEQKEE